MISYLIKVLIEVLPGIKVSFQIFTFTFIFAFPLAVILSFVQITIFRPVINFFTWIFRGTPLMLQLLFFFYFLFPKLQLTHVSRITVAIIAFIINYSAYFIEILRSGIQSVEKEQIEAARLEGASDFKVFIKITLPQAIVKEIPTITSEFITLIKDTALVTIIALNDFLRLIQGVVSRDFRLEPYILSAIFYLLISYIIVKIFRKIEQKINFI